MSKKMNQVLAIEKGIKTRTYAQLTELHRVAEKAELLNGFSKTYQPKQEDGQVLPPVTQRVQFTARDVFDEAKRSLAELFDVTASKDWGNTSARANVEVDGQLLIEGCPATYLLFLDKQLTDLHTFVKKFVELDSSKDWTQDPATGMFRTEAVPTQRTEKQQKAIVLYDATDKHPAQTQLITEDILVGYWNTVYYSGAIPPLRKKTLLTRIERLQSAVKQALEAANMTQVPEQRVGEKVLGYILAE